MRYACFRAFYLASALGLACARARLSYFMDKSRISTVSHGLDVQTDFAGFDNWTAADAAVLSLLYGQDSTPEGFGTGLAASAIPLTAICARLSLTAICANLSLTKDGLADCMARLARVSVHLTSGNQTLTAPLLDFYELGGGDDDEAMMTYAIPQRVVPHLATSSRACRA